MNVLLTGGSGRLGTSLVEELKLRGAAVRTMSRYADDSEALVADLSTPDSLISAAAAFVASTPAESRLVLIANASDRTSLEPDSFALASNDFEKILSVDVVGHFTLMRAIAELAIEREQTFHVVVVGSVYGLHAVDLSIYPDAMPASPMQYSVAKSALSGLVRDLSKRWNESRFTIVGAFLGGIEGDQPLEFKERYAKRTAIGRMLRIDEAARIVANMCSEDFVSLTGRSVVFDGGFGT